MDAGFPGVEAAAQLGCLRLDRMRPPAASQIRRGARRALRLSVCRAEGGAPHQRHGAFLLTCACSQPSTVNVTPRRIRDTRDRGLRCRAQPKAYRRPLLGYWLRQPDHSFAVQPLVSRFHTFRHSVGSFINALTGNLKLAQKLFGHSNLSTTADIYAHTSQKSEREAALAVERDLWRFLLKCSQF